jgi:hypothetical protein
VEVAPPALVRELFSQVESVSGNKVHKDTRSLIIKRLYFSQQHMDWSNFTRVTRGGSRHYHNSMHVSPPEKGVNIAEVEFLDKFGEEIPTEEFQRFLYCLVVSQWIASKGGMMTKNVFRGLKPPCKADVYKKFSGIIHVGV